MASDCTVAIDNGYINLRVGAVIFQIIVLLEKGIR